MGKVSIYDRFIGWLKDFMVVSAVVTTLFAATAYIARPVWQPFSQLPELVAELAMHVDAIRDRQELHVVDFDGPAQIVGDTQVQAGGEVRLLYYLRRNAPCESRLVIRFYNVDRGVMVGNTQVMAQKAPVTADYQLFKIDIGIPEGLRPGRYSYAPVLIPLNCPIFKPQNVPPSEIFEVIE